MVYAIGREPVHALDGDAHPFDDTRAHVAPRQAAGLVVGAGAHGADEPRVSISLQRKHREKIGRVERGVQLAIHRRAARFDVGDVKEVFVGTAGKTDRESLPYRGMRATAAPNKRSIARPARPLPTPATRGSGDTRA